MALIDERITACMADIKAVGKNDRNTQQGFMYRGIEATMNALAPVFEKNGVYVTPEVLEQTREERTNSEGTHLIYSILKIRFTFRAEDSSSVSCVTIGEGMDTGDKASNKAMSIAFKYALFQVFCIPTEEMVDPDAEAHEVAPKKITALTIGKIQKEQTRTGVTDKQICERYKVESLMELTEEQGRSCLAGLKKTVKEEAK